MRKTLEAHIRAAENAKEVTVQVAGIHSVARLFIETRAGGCGPPLGSLGPTPGPALLCPARPSLLLV